MSEVHSPAVVTRSGPSIVWLIPVVTLLIGAWLVVKTLSEQGPTATLTFLTAEGIEPGKTRIKYKSVEIGVVEDVRFADDFQSVVLTAQFNPGTDHFLRRNTRFWVVRPQLSVRGVSGLSTLVSGSFIEIDPGPGAPQRHFTGLEQQPLVSAGEAGHRITLVAPTLGSIDAGSPLYYQGILAGEVMGHELGSDRRSVFIHVFVREPFDQLVRGNSRFWNVSGLNVTMGADGFEVKTESVQALMFGGIAFDTPDNLEAASADVGDLVFTLHPNREAIDEQAYTRKIRFVAFFEGSVRGLSPGAPVEFKGIRVGSVQDVRLEFDPDDASFRIPVLLEIEPGRILARGTETEGATLATLQALVDRGLRARLQTGSLLTGQLFVELNMHPDTELRLVADNSVPYPELPTIPSGIEAITATVEGFVAQLDQVDLVAIAANLQGTLEGSNKLLNAPELQRSLVELEGSMAALRGILQDVDAADTGAAITAARGVLVNLERTLEIANDAFEPGAPLPHNLVRLTGELDETARAIRTLVEMLERRPQALIFGPAQED